MPGQWTLKLAFLMKTVFYAAMMQLIETNGKKVADIYWNSSNVMFTSDNQNQVFSVHILDRIDIICPKYSSNVNEQFVEYSAIYMVTKDGYDKCSLETGRTQIVTTCRKPYSDETFALVFREFTPNPNQLEFAPGRDYYFISTSNGSSNGLWNTEGGLCLHKNMRIHITVKERQGSYNEYEVTRSRNNVGNNLENSVDLIYDHNQPNNNNNGYPNLIRHGNNKLNPVRTPFNRIEQFSASKEKENRDLNYFPYNRNSHRIGQMTDRGRTNDNNRSNNGGFDGAEIRSSAVPGLHNSPSTPEKWPWWHFQNSYNYASFPPDSVKPRDNTPAPIRSSSTITKSCFTFSSIFCLFILLIIVIIF